MALGEIINGEILKGNLEKDATTLISMPIKTKLGLLHLKDRCSAVGGGAKYHSMAAVAWSKDEQKKMKDYK